MSIVLIILALAVLTALLARLVTTVRADGYGVRPAPRSHPTDGPSGTATGFWDHHPHV